MEFTRGNKNGSLGSKPRTGLYTQCNTCKKEIYLKPSYAAKTKRPTCSIECARKVKEDKDVLICDNCESVYLVPKSVTKWNKIRGHKKNFCSAKCSNRYYSQENNPGWKGGKYVTDRGYIRFNYDPAGTGRPYVYEHQWVMEKLLGRRLTKHEHVHHKNHNPGDNRIENLEILSPTEHAKLHMGRRIRKEDGTIH